MRYFSSAGFQLLKGPATKILVVSSGKTSATIVTCALHRHAKDYHTYTGYQGALHFGNFTDQGHLNFV
jgi:hypothetical protein